MGIKDLTQSPIPAKCLLLKIFIQILKNIKNKKLNNKIKNITNFIPQKYLFV